MTDTFSPTSPTPLAFFDPDSSCWRTWQGTSLWGDQMSLERLPEWGTASVGELYERPIPALLTAARGSSSSPQIGTPTAQSSATGRSDGPVYDPTSGKAPTPVELAQLLPTPTVSDSGGPGRAATKVGSDDLRTTISLLPTPTARDFKNVGDPDRTASRMELRGQPSADSKIGYSYNVRSNSETLPAALLPTSKATNNDNQQNLDRYGPNLGMALMPEQYEWTSAPTPPPSPAGNTSWDDQPPRPLNPDATGDHDSTPPLWNG